MWVRKIGKRGGSKSVVIPPTALQELRWDAGDHVVMYVLSDTQLVLAKFDPQKRPDLQTAAEADEAERERGLDTINV